MIQRRSIIAIRCLKDSQDQHFMIIFFMDGYEKLWSDAYELISVLRSCWQNATDLCDLN